MVNTSNAVPTEPKGPGAIIATGIGCSVIGGAVAGLVTYFIHVRYNVSLPEDQEQNLQTVFTSLLTGGGMLVHLGLRKFLA